MVKWSLLGEALSGRLISLKAGTRDLLAEVKKMMLPGPSWQTDSCRGFQSGLDGG
jgi:hypothetical protein